jgi:uncharacterized protein (TIGR03118 family)
MSEKEAAMMTLSHRHLCGGWLTLVLALSVFLVPSLQAGGKFYQQHNLVSDGFVPAEHTDANLVNPWGIVFSPTSPAWVADNATGVATLYDGNGVRRSLVVTIDSTGPVNPTGIVFNASSSDFAVSQGDASAPSLFIFASENGTIAGWAPTVDGTRAIRVVDNSSPEETRAIYKGLALAANGTGNFLYATDFHNGRIDVFDSKFQPAMPSGSFSDPLVPAGFGPFGIRNINGDLYVTYAKQDEEKEDDVAGEGLGVVDIFDANGNFIRRFADGGKLNAPWGLALAPADFGAFSNRLLVGNFGDGTINAYGLATGEFKGQLKGPDGQTLVNEGLWGISFGNGLQNQPTNVLFFAAGPADESHGLYGRIEPVPYDGTDEGVASGD